MPPRGQTGSDRNTSAIAAPNRSQGRCRYAYIVERDWHELEIKLSESGRP